MTFKSKCLLCGRTSYGWGNRCVCGLPVSNTVKLKHYGNVRTGKTVWEDEPNHDLEYHDKKCEEVNNND